MITTLTLSPPNLLRPLNYPPIRDRIQLAFNYLASKGYSLNGSNTVPYVCYEIGLQHPSTFYIYWRGNGKEIVEALKVSLPPERLFTNNPQGTWHRRDRVEWNTATSHRCVFVNENTAPYINIRVLSPIPLIAP